VQTVRCAQRGRSRLRELAREASAADRLPALWSAERSLLQRYVDLFNARDFETLRAMLAADSRPSERHPL
jgi:RNA polymerase sigma-70 factor, ECF subfamily